MPTLSPPELADRLQTEGEKTIAFFKTLPAEKWHTQIYTDGEHWTIHQILTHLTQAEDSLVRLIAHVVSGRGGVPEDFDLNGYNERKVKEMENETVENMLVQFAERRTRTVSFVGKLKEADLEKTGRHPFLGVSSVADMLQTMHLHTQLHRRDIRKLLNT